MLSFFFVERHKKTLSANITRCWMATCRVYHRKDLLFTRCKWISSCTASSTSSDDGYFSSKIKSLKWGRPKKLTLFLTFKKGSDLWDINLVFMWHHCLIQTNIYEFNLLWLLYQQPIYSPESKPLDEILYTYKIIELVRETNYMLDNYFVWTFVITQLADISRWCLWHVISDLIYVIQTCK